MTYVNLAFNEVHTRAGEHLIWMFAVRTREGLPVDITGWQFGLWAEDQANALNKIAVAAPDFVITDALGGLVQCEMARPLTVAFGGKTFTVTLWDLGRDDDLAEGDWIIDRTVRPAA